MFSEWARNPEAKNNRSFANGAAMRVMPIAYAYSDTEQMMLQVRASCLPTHNHPDAKKAARAVALAIRLALDGESKETIKSASRTASTISRHPFRESGRLTFLTAARPTAYRRP